MIIVPLTFEPVPVPTVWLLNKAAQGWASEWKHKLDVSRRMYESAVGGVIFVIIFSQRKRRLAENWAWNKRWSMTSKNGWKGTISVTKCTRHFEGNTHTLDRTSYPKFFNFLTVLQSQGSILWSSVAITQSESIFWVWLPVSFHLVSCFTTAHRFPSMELHVEHFACSCTKLCKLSKWLMCSFANVRSKARVLSPKHLDVLTLTYVLECNESLPRSHDNHSA